MKENIVNVIIFSFNRAMQLEALLRSIYLHWEPSRIKVTVIYNVSDDEYQKGYNILNNDYPATAFCKETNKSSNYHWSDYCVPYNWIKFLKYKHTRKQKSNFRDLLCETLKNSPCPYTMFLTDDSEFFRDVRLTTEELSFIDQDIEQNQISLRLGIDNRQKPQEIVVGDDGRIRWEFRKYRNARSWGYNFSVDAHIYSTDMLYRLLHRVIFNNPTTLEGHINDYVQKHGYFDRGMAFSEPCILSYPINMVQQIADNESLGISERKLNEWFLQGKLLEYPIPEEKTLFQVYPHQLYLKDKDSGQITIVNTDIHA